VLDGAESEEACKKQSRDVGFKVPRDPAIQACGDPRGESEGLKTGFAPAEPKEQGPELDQEPSSYQTSARGVVACSWKRPYPLNGSSWNALVLLFCFLISPNNGLHMLQPGGSQYSNLSIASVLACHHFRGCGQGMGLNPRWMRGNQNKMVGEIMQS